MGEHGAAGYGIYWRIIEMLHSDDDHILPLKKYIYLAIAKQMLTDAKQIEAIINDCINTYELIVSDGEIFWSERVLRNIETRDGISKKRAEAGKLGAERRKQLADAKQLSASAKQNAAKERKGKETKLEETKKIQYGDCVFLSDDDYSKLKNEYGEEATNDMIKILDNYKVSNGKNYKSDYRAILSWVVDRWNEKNKKGTNGTHQRVTTRTEQVNREAAETLASINARL